MSDFKVGDEVITSCVNHPGQKGIITQTYSSGSCDVDLGPGDGCYAYRGELRLANPPAVAPESEAFVWLDYAEDIARVARLLNNFVEALNESLPGSNSDLEWRLEDGGVRAYLYDEPTPWIVKRSESVEAVGLVIE